MQRLLVIACWCAVLLLPVTHSAIQGGMLRVLETETREVKDISGIWQFKLDPNNVGMQDRWCEGLPKPTIDIPVPSSYNDLGIAPGKFDYQNPDH